MNFIKNNLKDIMIFCLGFICTGITVYAVNYLPEKILFVPNDNTWEVTNVKEAIDSLYESKNSSSDFNYNNFIGVQWVYDYKGEEDTFIAPVAGTYKLEAWGASGGYGVCSGSLSSSVNLGYGGYSVGNIKLDANEKIYINVGERGKNAVKKKNVEGSYNGGGGATWDTTDDEASAGGGGATHIAKVSGLLSTLENNISDIIMVSGGGGGNSCSRVAGSGGGFQGVTLSSTGSTPATQESGYAFGLGATGVGMGGNTTAGNDGVGGGGGGFYGGFMNNVLYASAGTGGSGYIGNPVLTEKAMYCYNCVESTEVATKTIATTNVSSDPVSGYAKKDNGYVRITFMGIN